MEAPSRPAILIITPRFPLPAIGGDRLRISSIIEHLSDDFDIDVFSFYSRDSELSHLPRLQRMCRRVHVFRMGRAAKARNTVTGWVRGLPLQVAHYYSRAAQTQIDRLVRRNGYDAVVAHLVRSAEYTRGMPPGRVVIEMTDAIAMNYYRITRPHTPMEALYLVERGRLAGYEADAVGRAAAAVVVADTDRRFLEERGARGEVRVITNGTDVTLPAGVTADRRTIAFLGNLRYAPNEDMVVRFATAILPRVLRTRPDARFVVIGANPTRRVQRLHNGSSIVVTGEVSDPAPVLAAARVSVCPMRFGAGVQNKVLESMALGVPVVATSAGHEGIPAEADREILLADDDDSFADRVLRVLSDDRLHAELAAAGREFIDRSFRWPQQMAAYRELLRSAASAGGQA